jgi:hypothetical protein
MHICMDEIRMAVAAVHDIPTLIALVRGLLRRAWVRVRAVCRRCYHCPENRDAP